LIFSLYVSLVLLMVFPAYTVAQPDAARSADARFDKTGDGIVDASDWKLMNKIEKQGYARDSLRELGLDPDVSVGDGKTRTDHYLDGLRTVYGQ